MALQIWLPLNGDANNLGLANFQPAAASLTYNTSGKVTSKCAYFNSSHINIPNSILTSTSHFSIAFWAKLSNTDGKYYTLFCDRLEIGEGVSIFYNSSIGGFRFDTGPTAYQHTFSVEDKYENIWTHYCFTFNGKEKCLYVNGVKNKSVNYTGQLTNIGNSILIGKEEIANPSHPILNSYLNDYRVYDHCLSANEVKILSQGLVAHYKLEGLKLTNLVPQDSDFESGSWGGIATTHSQSYTGDKSLYLKRGTTVAHESNFPKPIVGHKYYGREMIKTNGDVTATDCRFEIFGGDGPGKNWVFGVNRGNYPDWTMNSNIISIDSVVLESYGIRTFVVDSSNDVFIDSMIVIDLTAEFGAGNEPSKEWCDINIPYFTGTLEFTNTTDSSGYCNDGIASAPFTFSPDTKRYKTSTIFKDNKYINCGRGAMVTDALTVSCWVYCDNWSNVGRIISCTQNGGWDFWPNASGQMTMEVYRNNGYITGLSSTNLSAWSSGWHHIVGTYDGYKAEIYIDGIRGTSSATTTTKYPIKYNNTNSLFIGAEPSDNPDTPEGVYFTGKISDVRIYATTFTEQDVQRLYNTPISLSNDGTLNALEYVETSLSKFAKTGLIVADTIRDCNATGDTQATKLQIFKNATQATDFIEW